MTEEQLELITELAESYMALHEIALVLGIDKDEFYTKANTKGNDVHTAIQKGRLLSKAAVRKSIFSMAKAGSQPAQQMVFKIIEESKIDDALSS